MPTQFLAFYSLWPVPLFPLRLSYHGQRCCKMPPSSKLYRQALERCCICKIFWTRLSLTLRFCALALQDLRLKKTCWLKTRRLLDRRLSRALDILTMQPSFYRLSTPVITKVWQMWWFKEPNSAFTYVAKGILLRSQGSIVWRTMKTGLMKTSPLSCTQQALDIVALQFSKNILLWNFRPILR